MRSTSWEIRNFIPAFLLIRVTFTAHLFTFFSFLSLTLWLKVRCRLSWFACGWRPRHFVILLLPSPFTHHARFLFIHHTEKPSVKCLFYRKLKLNRNKNLLCFMLSRFSVDPIRRSHSSTTTTWCWLRFLNRRCGPVQDTYLPRSGVYK